MIIKMNNNENNVSLSDLANGAIPTATPVGMPVKPKLNTANVREANISEVVRPSEPEVIEGTGNPMLDKAFLGINSTIARLQSETDTTYQKGEEERIEKAIDSDDGDIDSIDDNDEFLLPEDMISSVKDIILKSWNGNLQTNVVRETNEEPSINLTK